MSSVGVGEEPRTWGKEERVSLKVNPDACQHNFMSRVELLHFLIPTGEVVLVLAFTDEPKQTRALAISVGVLHRITSALFGRGGGVKLLKTYFLIL